MNPTHPDPPEHDELPSIDALIAGTVALMTAWADPCPHAPVGPAHLRHLIARKVVSNLFFLQHHPCARPELRQSLAAAHAQWVGLAVRTQQDAQATVVPVERCGHPGQHLH
jgi:hypothetical protein